MRLCNPMPPCGRGMTKFPIRPCCLASSQSHPGQCAMCLVFGTSWPCLQHLQFHMDTSFLPWLRAVWVTSKKCRGRVAKITVSLIHKLEISIMWIDPQTTYVCSFRTRIHRSQPRSQKLKRSTQQMSMGPWEGEPGTLGAWGL